MELKQAESRHAQDRWALGMTKQLLLPKSPPCSLGFVLGTLKADEKGHVRVHGQSIPTALDEMVELV